MTDTLAVLVSASFLVAAPAFALGINLDVLVNPLLSNNNVFVEGQDIAAVVYLELDPTVPAGGPFADVVTAIRVEMDTSGLLIPGTEPALIWHAPDARRTNGEHDHIFVGPNGHVGGDVISSLLNPNLSVGGTDYQTFAQVPQTEYQLNTVSFGVAVDGTIAGFSDPPLAAEIPAAFAGIDLNASNILANSMHLFFSNFNNAPGDPTIIAFEGVITNVTPVPLPTSVLLLASAFGYLHARRR